MKKKVLLLFIFSFVLFLAWCGKQQEEQKQVFFIDVEPFASVDKSVYITKPGRVSGKQDIVVTSQVAGRVKSLQKKDWDIISWQQLVVSISDTVANYGLQLQRAKSALSRASLQSKQTEISLDKSLKDVSLALDVAKNNYTTTQQTTDQSLRQAELWLSSADSQSQNIQLQFPVEKANLLNIMNSILDQIDTYLWVTDKYKTYNDNYEIYLSAKNSSFRIQAETLLRNLYKVRSEIESFPSNSDQTINVSQWIVVLEKGYDASKQLLDTMTNVFINSVESVSFPKTTIDMYKATVDGFKASLQWSKSAFVAYRKQITALTSQLEWWTVDISKAQAEVAYDTTRITSDNALYSSEVGVKSAETNYDTLLKNKDVQLGMAKNAVYEANLAYQDALSRYNNLSVSSPISGVIGNILVDVWQEVGPGTPLFTVSSNDQQTIEMYVTAEERWYISLDDPVKILYDWKTFTWKILSVASVADRNTQYKVVVAFDDSVSLLGDIASIQLPVKLPYAVVPLNVVTPISKDKGFVWVYDGSWVQRQDVVLGRVWSSYIEILSWLSDSMNIITNDISYFDSTKFVLQPNKE